MVNDAGSRPEPARQENETFWAITLLGLLALFVIAGAVINHYVTVDNKKYAELFTQWKVLLGVIATLGIFSILYKENPTYRFLEHIFIGLAVGFGVVATWVEILWPRWFIPMLPANMVKATDFHGVSEGQWWLFFALPIALLFYSVYFPRLAWMNRLLISTIIGYYAGYELAGFIGLLGPQITKSFKPPVTTYAPEGAATGANNFQFLGVYWHPFAIIFLVVLVCTLAFFIFSVEHRRRWISQPAIAGRYFIMITLGAIFGTTVMGRFSLVISRFQFLIEAVKDWWHLIFK